MLIVIHDFLIEEQNFYFRLRKTHELLKAALSNVTGENQIFKWFVWFWRDLVEDYEHSVYPSACCIDRNDKKLCKIVLIDRWATIVELIGRLDLL